MPILIGGTLGYGASFGALGLPVPPIGFEYRRVVFNGEFVVHNDRPVYALTEKT